MAACDSMSNRPNSLMAAGYQQIGLTQQLVGNTTNDMTKTNNSVGGN